MAPTKKPTPKVDHIRAKFGGRDLVFRIPRDHLHGFEQGIAEAAQLRFRKIVAGQARFDEVLEVLEFAAPSGLGRKIPMSQSDLLWSQFRKTPMGQADFSRAGEHSSFVAKTLSTNAPAKYALLAQAVIAACLYGVPEEAAVFDEDEVDTEEDEAHAES